MNLPNSRVEEIKTHGPMPYPQDSCLITYSVETVFCPLNDSGPKRLQKCQYATASLVLGRYVKDPKDLKTLGWLSMKARRDFHILQHFITHIFNSRRHKVKKVTRRHKGGGGQSDPSPLFLTPLIRLTRYLAHIMSVLCTFN